MALPRHGRISETAEVLPAQHLLEPLADSALQPRMPWAFGVMFILLTSLLLWAGLGIASRLLAG